MTWVWTSGGRVKCLVNAVYLEQSLEEPFIQDKAWHFQEGDQDELNRVGPAQHSSNGNEDSGCAHFSFYQAAQKQCKQWLPNWKMCCDEISQLWSVRSYLLKSSLTFPLWISKPLSMTAIWVAMTATRTLKAEALKLYLSRNVHKKPKPSITITFTSWNSAWEEIYLSLLLCFSWSLRQPSSCVQQL